MFMACRYGRIQCNGYMCTVYNVHALACCLLCSRGCAIADMMNALFRLLLSALYCWLVGWFVVCSVLHSDDRMVFRLFIRLLRFILAQANNAMRLCIVRMLSTIQCFTTLTLTLLHTHTLTHPHICMHDHAHEYANGCGCVCAIDKVNFNFIRRLSLLLVMFGIRFIHFFTI